MSDNGQKLAFKAINGNGSGYPNGRNAWANIRKESLALGLAEIVSMGTSMGVVGVADQIAPGLLKTCSSMLGKVLEPYIGGIEKGLKFFCRLEGCQPDLTKSREERAEALAKVAIVFSSAWTISMAAKLATRKGVNQAFKLTVPAPRTGKWYKDFYNDYLKPSQHDVQVFKWDEFVHYGSLLLLNTVGARANDELLHTTSNVLQKIGFSKQKADDLATMGVVWELPNLLGFVAGIGAITKHHTSGNGNSHVNKLMQESASSSSLSKT